MNADKTADTIWSNKIVLNEIKDNQVLLELYYGKKQKNLSAIPIVSSPTFKF